MLSILPRPQHLDVLCGKRVVDMAWPSCNLRSCKKILATVIILEEYSALTIALRSKSVQ